MTDDKQQIHVDHFARRFQMVLGGMLWVGMLCYDLWAGTELSELSTQRLIILGVRYGFAAILLTGTTASEFSDIIRAWKGK